MISPHPQMGKVRYARGKDGIVSSAMKGSLTKQEAKLDSSMRGVIDACSASPMTGVSPISSISSRNSEKSAHEARDENDNF